MIGLACVLAARVPEEVRVGRRVVPVAGLGGDGLLVRLLRGRQVVARLPQERRVPPQRLRVRRLRTHRPLEVVLCPACTREKKVLLSATVIKNPSQYRRCLSVEQYCGTHRS